MVNFTSLGHSRSVGISMDGREYRIACMLYNGREITPKLSVKLYCCASRDCTFIFMQSSDGDRTVRCLLLLHLFLLVWTTAFSVSFSSSLPVHSKTWLRLAQNLHITISGLKLITFNNYWFLFENARSLYSWTSPQHSKHNFHRLRK